jgi:hypothetical protein
VIPLNILDQVYAAAANAGLLHTCIWHRFNAEPEICKVGLRAPDEALLDHLARSRDTTMRYPSSVLVGLKIGDRIEIATQHYRVRDLKAIGDGSEWQAQLSRF